MNNEKYKSTIGFTDLLFNILVGFAFLFIIAFLLIKPEAKKEDFNRRAEFVVVMEWDHDAKGDIDLYVEDPTNKQVSFRYHNHNYMPTGVIDKHLQHIHDHHLEESKQAEKEHKQENQKQLQSQSFSLCKF